MKFDKFVSKRGNFTLYQGDTFEVLPNLNDKFDLIFADPPYFLSNDGLSIQFNYELVEVVQQA